MRRTFWLGTGLAAALGVALALGATLASGQGAHGHAYGPTTTGTQGGTAQGSAGRVFFAALFGRNELAGEPLRRGAGDPDGRGSANVTIDGTTICFGISVTNVSQPVAAHIHRGKRNQNGPIVVTLVAPSSGDPGASSGCVQPDADPNVAQAIRRHPKRYYVNVHTGDFPGGAVRGQLFSKRR